MKRRIPARPLAIGAGLLVAALIGVALAPNLRGDPPGASPSTLSRIARKNDNATIEAAAQLREQSRAATQATDSLRAAQERGRAGADESIARFDNQEATPAVAPTAPRTADQ